MADFIAPTVLIMAIAYMTASMFMDVFHMAVDTVIMCYITDEEQNDGRAVFADPEITKFVSANGKLTAEHKRYDKLILISSANREHLRKIVCILLKRSSSYCDCSSTMSALTFYLYNNSSVLALRKRKLLQVPGQERRLQQTGQTMFKCEKTTFVSHCSSQQVYFVYLPSKRSFYFALY